MAGARYRRAMRAHRSNRPLLPLTALWLLLVALPHGACSPGLPATPPPPAPAGVLDVDAAAVVVAPPPSDDDAGAAAGAVAARREALAARYLAPSTARVLYTWTTPEQLAALRAGERVLSRESSPDKGYAGFDHLVSQLAHQPGVDENREVPELLFHAGYAKKRFAWHTAFGAILGLGAGPYGSVLLRMTLKPSAVISEFVAETVRVDGKTMPARELAKFPERLGAIYYEGPGYHEIVLPNESMIEEVTANTDTIRRELEDELFFLQGIREDELRTRELAHAFVGAPPYSVEALEPYVTRLRAFLDQMPAEAFVRRPNVPFQLGAKRAQLPFCRATGRKRVATHDISHPVYVVQVQCAPADACRPNHDVCRPVPRAFQ